MMNLLFFLATLFANVNAKECSPLKSLRAIYGSSSFQVQKTRAVVGIIGSGLDYNHPGLARFLAARAGQEAGLQNLENSFEYQKQSDCERQLIQEEQNLGFPRWMDQALGSPWPMDQIYEDGILQPQREHETRVASRIIYGRDDVSLHFVRRMYGKQMDIFNAYQAIYHFRRQGVQVINMSFGSDCGKFSREEKAWEEIFKFYSKMIFVIAAGNSGKNLDYVRYCPARFSKDYPNVISVTSVASDNGISVNYDVELGREILVNYGKSVDVAIKSDSLPVLIPYQHEAGWVTHETGWTSHAAAEVSRILAHAIADGYVVEPHAVKEQLMKTSRKNRHLREFVKSGGEVDEAAFRAILAQ
jgi:Subtilase family